MGEKREERDRVGKEKGLRYEGARKDKREDQEGERGREETGEERERTEGDLPNITTYSALLLVCLSMDHQPDNNNRVRRVIACTPVIITEHNVMERGLAMWP